ncbi:ApeA N-terminal domain 1-containing protein [Runella aurantiaca]|uniref:Uncharacterized protein n=1 Tax=Runella aurantiaca TaxID=2282308 RepID=A0A369IC25_9BACT|nr:HEPN domain-containing protein [Runella aurantiaca]RDB07319.1 hypothetical protein DVG78_04735 [Runella aurantiaca]
MNEELEIDVLGFWWIPEHSETKWPGRLTFSKSEGGILEIFQNEQHKEFEKHKTYQAIRGSANGEGFTLYRATLYNSTQNQPNGISYYRLKSDTIVAGQFCLENEEDFQFSELGVKLSNINEWFRQLKAYEVKDVSDKNTLLSTTIQYSSEAITFSINDLLEGRISTGFNLHHSINDFNASKQLWFNIISKDKSLIPYETLMKKINFLRVFFSVVLGGKCVYEQLRIERSDLKSVYNIGRLYSRNSFGPPSKGYVLFELEDLENRLGEVIEKWLHICEEMPEVINLLYTTYTAKPIYDYHFRESYIALEGLYHWRLEKDTPENVISPLVQPFMHISKFGEIIGDYKKWWKVAKNNRHYQMHLNKIKYANDIVSTSDLVKLMRKMEAIILCHILKELGFSDGEINQVFTKVEKRFIFNFF